MAAVALIALLAVTYWVYSEYVGPYFEAARKERHLDEITTLVDVKYQSPKTIFWYVMDIEDDAAVDFRQVERNMQKGLCAVKESLRGYTYVYHYANKARVPLATFMITKCPAEYARNQIQLRPRAIKRLH